MVGDQSGAPLHGQAADNKDIAQIRRAYRATFAASVCLAAIGAPLLMQGAVALVRGLIQARDAAGSLMPALLFFALSTVPMTLAALAWRRTQEFQAKIDQEV